VKPALVSIADVENGGVVDEDFQGVVNFLKDGGGREINRVCVDTLGPPRMDVTPRPRPHSPQPLFLISETKRPRGLGAECG
jgi:hypothetical protein